MIGRVSEIKKYSPKINDSISSSILTIEIPSSIKEESWSMSEDELVEVCRKDLQDMGVINRGNSIKKRFIKRFQKCYPLYTSGWSKNYENIQNRLDYDNLYLLGRAGLFLHCNIDHGIRQGLLLADSILAEKSSKKQWLEKEPDFRRCQARE